MNKKLKNNSIYFKKIIFWKNVKFLLSFSLKKIYLYL